MAFSEIEMAIFAQLAYKDVNFRAAAEEPLSTLLNNNKKWLIKELGEPYKKYIERLIDKVKDKNYTIVASQSDTFFGFSAFAFSTPENEVVVACRGSTDVMDWINNISLGFCIETTQHKEMEDFVDQLEKQGYDGYYFTGHSLGGNLAIHGAVTVDDTSKVRGVYTYNSPGFNEGYWDLHGEKLRQLHFCITNYQNEYDYVSSLLHLPGKNVIIASSVTDGHIGFDDHSIDAFEIDDTGSFVPNKSGKRAQTYLASGFSAWVTGNKYIQGSMIAQFLVYMYLESNNHEICRDFSAETKEMLISIAKEVENEEWWDITKWDCWYKVEKFFGVLEWDLYCGNVESYNRKLIDINDASVKDIKKIFKKVYELDSSYSTKINSQGEKFKSKVTGKLQKLRDSIVVA